MTLNPLCKIVFITCILFSKTAAANFFPVCKDEEAILDCSVPGGTWKYKKKGETIQTSLTEWHNGHNRVSPHTPQIFDGRITVADNNTLTIASFKWEHNGIYICKSNTPVLYHVIAVQCKAMACIGDQVNLECGSFLGTEPIRELAWHVNNTKALVANEDLHVEYRKDEFDWLILNGDIPAALKVHVVSPHVQRFTCVTYDGDDGVTPRRSRVTLYPQYCATNTTVRDNSRVKEVSSDASVHDVISHGNRLKLWWMLVILIAGYVTSFS